MKKIMTISVNKEFLILMENLSKETNLKKSTIVKIAVEQWSKKNEKI